ncbi:MAG: 4a-hydroxytetrahydrobiopterin dehydratase [Candidatus Paceibacterota bacterium]
MSKDLINKKCVPCEGGMSPLSPDEIKEYKSQVDNSWEVEDNKKIKRNFSFDDFKEAMKFINKVADLAEEEGHHPDIFVSYNKVKITLWTHAISGLSENDFIVAAKTDNLI